jgi:hypothetical protein
MSQWIIDICTFPDDVTSKEGKSRKRKYNKE